MSPTVPTTTDSRDDEDSDDPSWIFRQIDARRRPSLPTPPGPGVDPSTGRRQHCDRQREDRHQQLLGWSGRDPGDEGIADAYAGLVTVIGNKGKVDAESGDCWLMSHQSSSPAPKGTAVGGGVGNRDAAIKTAEFWIHQLRSVLHETRSNLNLIVAFHQRQLQQQQQQAKQLPAAEDPSRAIIRSGKSDVAVQTDLANNEEETGQPAAVNAQSKSNYYLESVGQASGGSHVATGSLIGQLSSPPLPLHNSTARASSRSQGLSEYLADDGHVSCHFIRASNSCCAPSAHSCSFHSRCCCRATNRRILSQQPSRSSRTKRTASRKRPEEDKTERTNGDTEAISLLNEAWQLAGLHTRQRMSILSRHYRILYERHRRLRRRHGQLSRIFQRTRRRALYVQFQLQILLESIGSQVDDVASDWVDRLKALLRLQAFNDRDRAATDGQTGAPTSTSSPDVSYSPLDFAKDSTGHRRRPQQQFRVNDDDSFSLYRWYSSLSLKLSWLQTSHGTVLENLLLWIPRA